MELIRLSRAIHEPSPFYPNGSSQHVRYTGRMNNIIQFMVTEEDGIYTADGVNVPIVTEGGTFEDLQTNIREAVALYFEGEPAARQFG